MNILFIIPSLQGGGAEKVTSIIAGELARDNDVTIVTYKDSGKPFLLAKKVKTINLNLYGGSPFRKIINSIKRIRRITAIKNEYKIDTTISMLVMPNFENVMSKRHDRVIISIRNNESVELKGLKRLIHKVTLAKCDYVVAVSKQVLDNQIAEFHCPPQKITTINNPCDAKTIINRCNEAPSDFQFDEIERNNESLSDSGFCEIRRKHQLLYVSIGRLSKQKGQWHLINAFSRLAERNSNIALIILGEGEFRKSLEEYIKKKGLQDRVYLLGYCENPYYYLSRSDVFVMSSLYEGFSNALLEAMACSLPIVCADCVAGTRELLEEGANPPYGILTKAFDTNDYTFYDSLSEEEEALADAMAAMMDEDVRKQYINKSMERILDYSLEKIMKQWVQIL